MTTTTKSASTDLDSFAMFKTADVASLLAVTTETLRLWRLDGSGPPYVELESGQVRYPKVDLLNWLTERTRKPSPPSPSQQAETAAPLSGATVAAP